MGNELINKKENQFGPFEAALATLLFVVFNVLFMELYVATVKSFGYLTDLGLLLAQFLVEALFGVAAVVTALVCKKNIVKAAGLNKKVTINMVIYCVLVAFCCIVFFAPLTSSFIEFMTLVGYKTSSASMPINNFGNYIGYVIAACVTPAICEELLFRGAIQGGLKKFGKWVSIISASLIFMLMHGGPEQTIHQFIVGVIVGLMFYETGNLWASVVVHFFNNFISVTELFIYNMLIAPNLAEEGAAEVVEISMAEAWQGFFVSLVVALIFAAIGFFAVRYLIKKIKEENQKANGEVMAAGAQTILVDGAAVETEVLVDGETATEEILTENKPDGKKLDTKTIVCFAIPIAWLMFEWIYALISGFGG